MRKPTEGETLSSYMAAVATRADQVAEAVAGWTAAQADREAPEGYERLAGLGTVELRAAAGEAPAQLVGHAAVFNSLSVDLGMFREQVDPEAFDRSLADGDDVRALWNHDPGLVLGRTASGTLTLGTDERGLTFQVTPPDTVWARDLLVSVERGDVSQASFGFLMRKDTWDEESGPLPIRTLLDVKLLDVSPVTYPAYAATDTVAQRSLDTWRRARGRDRPFERGLNRKWWRLLRRLEGAGS